MKRIYFLIIALLLCSAIAQAKFCTYCGENIPDLAQFCSKCGNKQTIANKNTKNINSSSNAIPARALIRTISTNKKTTKTLLRKINSFYKSKTDIYLYEKRNHKRNTFKKNIFFKPRRYKMKRNSNFKVIEMVGGSCLVQSKPDTDGHTIKGWVYNKQLSLRSDWIK